MNDNKYFDRYKRFHSKVRDKQHKYRITCVIPKEYMHGDALHYDEMVCSKDVVGWGDTGFWPAHMFIANIVYKKICEREGHIDVEP